jgi:hypothetical protein
MIEMPVHDASAIHEALLGLPRCCVWAMGHIIRCRMRSDGTWTQGSVHAALHQHTFTTVVVSAWEAATQPGHCLSCRIKVWCPMHRQARQVCCHHHSRHTRFTTFVNNMLVASVDALQ